MEKGNSVCILTIPSSSDNFESWSFASGSDCFDDSSASTAFKSNSNYTVTGIFIRDVRQIVDVFVSVGGT